jgi:CheY-like chemotaxis protein
LYVIKPFARVISKKGSAMSSLSTTTTPGAKTKSTPEKPQWHGRVLTAEDAHCVQMTLCHLLRSMNLDVDTADDGQEACNKAMASLAEGRPYDVILMDMQMPKWNGVQAAQFLRRNGWKGPVIAVSMHTTDRERDEFTRAGCNDYISKPVCEASLREVLTPYFQPMWADGLS